jgi:hypothetical protein
VAGQTLTHEAGAGTQQPVELPAGLQFIQPSERRDHTLTHLIAGAVAFDDLQLEAPLRLRLRRKYMRDPTWVRTGCRG